jgi:tRNA(fMet)-specific endonuclease VapC
MKRFLLDTGPAQQFINNQGEIRRRADIERQRGNKIGICFPVLGELWSGIEGSDTREDNLRRLRHNLSRLLIWPFDSAAAAEFGRIFIQLKRLARPIQQIDIQIAAIALTLGNCTVVTSDSDFSIIPNVAVENWARPIEKVNS